MYNDGQQNIPDKQLVIMRKSFVLTLQQTSQLIISEYGLLMTQQVLPQFTSPQFRYSVPTTPPYRQIPYRTSLSGVSLPVCPLSPTSKTYHTKIRLSYQFSTLSLAAIRPLDKVNFRYQYIQTGSDPPRLVQHGICQDHNIASAHVTRPRLATAFPHRIIAKHAASRPTHWCVVKTWSQRDRSL